ncbi:MAG: M55 family metallopeptidase [Gammaproteobacteria bacterium]|nr:M55 family metallopeptidase [Gammaproteobacteria bacterium]MDH5345097.1 M55 family metallopeptidase [Gammaproteobacteria bacterium]
MPDRSKSNLNIRNRMLTAIALIIPAIAAAQDDGYKIYISADMEGVVGAVTGEQLGPEGFEYQRFRQFMTDEVNAAIDAARAAGATEFVISDSHGNGQNLLIEQLPIDVTIVRSWPRPLGMMEGIDDSFDGVIFIGYHASTANTRGVRAHTMSSASITGLRLNGIEMTEGSMNAAIAGHFGVPVIMVSGDDAAVAENQVIIGGIEGAVVKWAKGFHSAQTLTPEAAYEVIRTRTASAISRIDSFEPYVLDTPIELELSLKNYMPVETLSYLPNVEKVNSHTIRFVGQDMIEISKFLRVATGYSIDLQP